MQFSIWTSSSSHSALQRRICVHRHGASLFLCTGVGLLLLAYSALIQPVGKRAPDATARHGLSVSSSGLQPYMPETRPLPYQTARGLPPRSTAISLLACGHARELNSSLAALYRSSTGGRQRPDVFLSLDCPVHPEAAAVLDLARVWQQRGTGLRVSWFRQTDKEPLPAYAHERATSQWLSRLSYLFRLGYGYVVHMEGGHIASADFFDALRVAQERYAGNTTQCFNMGCHRDCQRKHPGKDGAVTWTDTGNTGAVFARAFWETLLQNLQEYCSLTGTWDARVRVLQARGVLPAPCLTYARPRVVRHLTDDARDTRGQQNTASLHVVSSCKEAVLEYFPSEDIPV